jgi:NAD(P)-dependent dehydrogenase (short-subunit alcohol dehydrogenase family)
MNPRKESPFTEDSTAAEVIAGVDLSGRRALVTGGSSGIGTETAWALASAGAEVTITGRTQPAVAAALAAIRSRPGGDRVSGALLDLGADASVDELVRTWDGPLHILVNNAGVMGLPDRTLAANGYELQFAVNHLGHFRLTSGLYPALRAAGGARVVSLSSRGHLRSPVMFDDVNFERRAYEPTMAYGQAKTANVLLAVGIAMNWAGDGITANAVHPGTVDSTNLARYMDPELVARIKSAPFFRHRTIAQGAATSVLVAASSVVDGVSGRYFEDCHESEVVRPELGGGTLGAGVAEYAVDEDNAKRLWDLSEDTLSA